MIKVILKVKKGKSTDIIFHELKGCNIISEIKDKQYNFFRKLQELPEHTSIMRNLIDLCSDNSTLDYYISLRGNNCRDFMRDLEEKIRTDDRSMISYYRNIIHQDISCIHNSFTNDYHRLIITRWRLSNHKLRIET